MKNSESDIRIVAQAIRAKFGGPTPRVDSTDRVGQIARRYAIAALDAVQELQRPPDRAVFIARSRQRWRNQGRAALREKIANCFPSVYPYHEPQQVCDRIHKIIWPR